MPKVPVYEGLRSDIAVQPQVQLRAPNTTAISEGAMQRGEAVARGLEQAGNVASRIAVDMQNDANQVRVNDGMNALVKARTALQVDLLAQKGRNAVERESKKALPDEYEEKLNAEIEALSSGLGNEAQRLAFQQQAAQLRNQFRDVATRHMIEQQGEYQKQVDATTIETAVDQYITFYGSEVERTQAVGAIAATIDRIAKREGWDAPTRELELAKAMSPAHATVIKNLIQTNRAEEAQAYYDANSLGMTRQARAAVQEPLQQAVTYQAATKAVDALLDQHGPKSPNDPFMIAELSKLLREQVGGKPDVLKLAEAELKDRMQLHNAEQSEFNAANEAAVWDLANNGARWPVIERSDAWLSLPATERRKIKMAYESERATRASRQASEAQRDLANQQRQDRLLLLNNSADYLADSDPTKLAGMSRQKVAALQSKYGFEGTRDLLAKWDSLQKPEKLAEAKMDQEDFNETAQGLNLNPYDPKKSEDERAALGNLKYRLERRIDEEQNRLGRTMSRQEKQKLMREEMARTVLVGNEQVPVITLTPEQLAEVKIPPADRQRIIAQMSARFYRAGTNDPIYNPTNEDNVRYWYVVSQSPAGALIRE